MPKKPLTNAEEVEVRSRAELRDWLGANHARPTGVWLVHHKKSSPHYLPMGEIVRECLAWGWVDSLSRGKDGTRTMHWIAPRDPNSNWSRINKDIVAELEAVGLMTAAGRALVEAAKANGSWTALDDVENLVLPDDLRSAFDHAPGTEDVWNDWPRSVKRAALEVLLNAKRPATRQSKIATIVDCAVRGERPFQWRKG